VPLGGIVTDKVVDPSRQRVDPSNRASARAPTRFILTDAVVNFTSDPRLAPDLATGRWEETALRRVMALPCPVRNTV
jgi:hypothetical protein